MAFHRFGHSRIISREQALRRVKKDNKPHFEAIWWYLNTINLDKDIEEVLEIINAIPKIRPCSQPVQGGD